MLRTEIKLNLRQNAVHTPYHAVEHLYLPESQSDAKEGQSPKRVHEGEPPSADC